MRNLEDETGFFFSALIVGGVSITDKSACKRGKEIGGRPKRMSWSYSEEKYSITGSFQWGEEQQHLFSLV